MANHFIRQFVDGAAGNAPPFFENAELAGHAPGEAQLLLDQEHRDSRLPIELEKNIPDLVHDIGLDPFGGLVQNEQRRLEHERATDRELLLLASGALAPTPMQHLLA